MADERGADYEKIRNLMEPSCRRFRVIVSGEGKLKRVRNDGDNLWTSVIER